jgi:hypothetical protein
MIGKVEKLLLEGKPPAGVVLVSADGCEFAGAHLPEAGDDFARIAAGELHGVFTQA